MSKYLPAWTIKQLQEKLLNDLTLCHTQLERDCCKAIGGKHIREMAQAWAQCRKLSPGEVAIAEQYGYRNNNENRL